MRPTIVLDFETYWDTKAKYSLKNLANFEYVTDPRFKAHGVAVLYPDSGEAFWVTHSDLGAFFADEDWRRHTVLMQNANFDGLIMQHHFDVLPGAFIDTRGMANAVVRPFTNSSSLAAVTEWLGMRGKIEGALESTDGIRDLPAEMEEQLSVYAVRDVEETYGVYERLREYFPACEYAVMDLHIKLYLRRLMRIDLDMLNRVRQLDREHRDQLAAKARETWPEHFEGKSTDEVLEMFRKQSFLANLIVDEGLLPPRKRSPTTGKITYAFSKTDVPFRRLAEKSERAKLLVECRSKASSNLIPNRLDKLELMHNRMRGFAHPFLSYYGAHTGRSSGGDSTNFQSMPKKPAEFRQIFVPKPGFKVLVCDSAQIEARVLAYVAGHEELLDIFREADALSRQGKDPKKLGKDVYSVMAEKVSAESRDFGKAVVLGCIAEGQLVLTDHGWKPIEQVSIDDKVWDGEEFVTHDGVIYQGVKEVITYDGLTATPDHIVFTEEGEMPLGEAMDREAKRWIPPSAPFSLYIDEGLIRVRRQARVYDILNAGPRHRYMVSGWVVHNCGYGMSLKKFVTFAAQVGLTDTTAVARAWTGWRAANGPIVDFWYEYEQAFTTAALARRHVSFRGLELEPFKEDGLLVWLPSGRYIAYGGLKRVFGQLVSARSTLWYGSLVENLVQAYARDVVFYQLLSRPELAQWVWLLVHDEANLVVPEAAAERYRESLQDAFRTPLPWCEDLPVFGDAVVLDRLKKV